MNSLPVFTELVPPPPPTDDVNASTLGSPASTAATAFWCRTMASKESPSAPSVVAMRMPMSSLGMKPFGTATAQAIVAARTAAEKRRVALLLATTRASVFS